MSTTEVKPPTGESASPPPPAREHTIPGRWTAPGGRAVIGGLLIAVAAVGTFLLASGSASSRLTPVVVAARDLPPGTHLAAQDVQVVRVEIAETLATHTWPSGDRLTGAVTLGPLRRGELVQAGDVVFKSTESLPEVSFSIPLARALGGDLRSGETVDVLSTPRNGSGESARVAVSGALVLKVNGQSSGALGRTGDVMITVAVPTRSEAAALVGAADTGNITLVRTTGSNTVALSRPTSVALSRPTSVASTERR